MKLRDVMLCIRFRAPGLSYNGIKYLVMRDMDVTYIVPAEIGRPDEGWRCYVGQAWNISSFTMLEFIISSVRLSP